MEAYKEGWEILFNKKEITETKNTRNPKRVTLQQKQNDCHPVGAFFFKYFMENRNIIREKWGIQERMGDLSRKKWTSDTDRSTTKA